MCVAVFCFCVGYHICVFMSCSQELDIFKWHSLVSFKPIYVCYIKMYFKSCLSNADLVFMIGLHCSWDSHEKKGTIKDHLVYFCFYVFLYQKASTLSLYFFYKEKCFVIIQIKYQLGSVGHFSIRSGNVLIKALLLKWKYSSPSFFVQFGCDRENPMECFHSLHRTKC